MKKMNKSLKYILTLFLLLLTSCNYNPIEVESVSEYCFEVEKYDKTVCIETPYDSVYSVLYIDKPGFQKKSEKFKDLKMYVMMVVEVEGDIVTLSDLSYSIKVEFKKNVPQLQEMFYIIVKEEYLSESVIIEAPFMIQQEGSDTSYVDEP